MRRLVLPMLALVLYFAPSAFAQPGRSFTPPPTFTPPPRPPVFTPPPTYTPPNTGSMDFARRMADQRGIDNTIQRTQNQTRMQNEADRMRRMTASGGNAGDGGGIGNAAMAAVAPPPKRVREAEPTVVVTAVKAGGLGEKAGLKVGDILESYAGVELRATAQTVAVIKKRAEAAGNLPLVVIRAKEEITLVVRPGLLGVTLVTNLPPGG